jgi:predicted PurR-regulated permease PerM
LSNSNHKKKKAIIINICIIAVCIVIIMLAWSIRSVIMPFAIAVVLSYIINPAVRALNKKNVPVVWSVVIIYLYLFAALYGLVFFVLPNVLGEVDTLLATIPQFLSQGESMLNNNLPNLDKIPFMQDIFGASGNMNQKINVYINDMMSDVGKSLEDSFTYVISFLFAPILSYYILRDKGIIKKKIVSFLPPKERPEILRIANDVDHILQQFIYGYLFVAAIVGLLSGIALAILGVKYALVLGVIMAIADLIPYFGPFFGILVAMAFALMESPTLAFYVFIVLGAIQQFESFVLSPKIIGFRTGLHPLTVIFVVLAGGYWFGILGMIFAVPVSAALKLILSFIYSRLVAFKDKNSENVLENQTGISEKDLNKMVIDEIIKKMIK